MSLRTSIYQEIETLCKNADAIVHAEDFEQPPEPEMGDIAVPCFALAKELKKAPPRIAQDIAKNIQTDNAIYVASVKANGPYVNFTLKTDVVADYVLSYIEERADAYGSDKTQSQTIQFEYSQPNTHKAFHIGHLRNAVLGYALTKLLASQGNTVHAVTYVNDVGSHVAKCLWGLETFFEGNIPQNERGRFLGNVYAKAAQELEDHPEYHTRVSEILRKLESEDADTMKRWKETRQWSLDGFETIYKDLNISFEKTYCESEVKQRGHAIVDELLNKGIARESEGAVIVDLSEYGLDVLVVRKSDGTGLYATSDLGLAEEKAKEEWNESIVLTDIRQSLYFKQLVKALELMGNTRVFKHLGYELVRLVGSSMSSRKGTVILYEDFRDEVIVYARQETSARHTDWSEEKIDETAHALALAAIKFSMLRVKPENIITFDKEEALSFSGFSAPYILYTNARIASIIKKQTVNEAHGHSFDHPCEKELVIMLSRWEETVSRAAHENNPSDICTYLHNLARAFSAFYEACTIKDAQPAAAYGRMRLIQAITQTMENGLTLLGIPVLREM